MAENVAASMTASIIIDKNDLVAQALKQLSETQKELDKNKLEIYFDLSNADVSKKLKEYQKQLASTDYTIKINNDGIEETYHSLDKLLDVIKNIANNKNFGTGFDNINVQNLTKQLDNMEKSLSSIKKVLVDVGDGGEFSPLLSTIEKVNDSVKELSSNVKGINLNMNLDLGSDKDFTSKIEAKTAGVLHAYENLFNQIKKSGTLSQAEQGIVDNFNIGNFDGMEAKISEYERLIKELRAAQKSTYNGKDYLRSDIDNKYWTAVSGAKQALSLAKKSGSQDNPLKDMFGVTDLSEVIAQLTTIAGKLDNIVSASQELKNSLAQGLNVNSSVEEVTKLTDRVKELESELEKVKTSSGNQRKDTFQGGSESSDMKDVEQASKEAAQAKQEFAEANKQVQSSIETSENPLKSEADLMDQVAKSAREAAEAKKEFVEANKQVKGSGGAGKKKDRYAKRSKISEDDFLSDSAMYSSIANDSLKNAGYTILGKTVSSELSNGLVKVSAQIKDADGVWSSFSAKIDADCNMFDKQLSTITKGINKLESELATFGKDEVKSKVTEEWRQDVNAIQEYFDAVTKLNNIKASDAGKNNRLNEIAGLEDEIVSLREKATTAKERLNELVNPDNVDNATWNSTVKAMKIFDQVTEGSIQSANRLKDALEKAKQTQFDSMDSSYKNYSDKYKSLQNSPAGYEHNSNYNAELQRYDDQLKAIQDKINVIKSQDVDLVDSKDLSELDTMYKKLDEIITSLKALPATQKGSTKESRQKVFNMINELKQFTGMTKESKLELEAMEQRFKNLGTNLNVSEAIGEVKAFKAQLVATNQTTKNLLDTVKDKAWYGWAAQLAGMFSFYDVINLGKQAFNVINELDYALIDLAKTTSMNESQLESYYYDANEVAKQMGVTTKEIIEQSGAWSRLGYNTADASETMAKLSSQFASISPGMDTDTAQEGLVSIMKAWRIDPDEVKSEIMDPINTLGNNFAESNQDIVEGMERSAAALAATGTTYKDAFALFTGAQEVLQNSEVAGRALRSISMRVHGYSENSEDGLMETDNKLKNVTGDLINLTKTAEHSQGVSIFKPGSTTEFKSLVDYFGEIHDIWDEMDQKQQNDFLQKAFGKTQAQAGSAIIKNYDAIKDSLKAIEDSAGSSDKEMDTVEKSLTYKLNALKETWVGTVQQIGDRGSIGNAIDGLTSLSEAVGNLLAGFLKLNTGISNLGGRLQGGTSLGGTLGTIIGLTQSLTGHGEIVLRPSF